MALSADETKTIVFLVEPIAKAMVEKKLDSLPALKQKLINKLLELRPETSKSAVKILAEISNITVSLIEQERSAQTRNTVNEIIKRINLMI
jgi:hypothetical protein